MFAGVETMKRYSDILLGIPFQWYTDHHPLEHLLKQKTLSGRQARWIESLSEFNFEIVYIEGVHNVLSNTLLCIYSNDAVGTVRSPSEYTQFNEDHPMDNISSLSISLPLFVGIEVNTLTTRSKTGAQPVWELKPKRVYNRRPKNLEAPPSAHEASSTVNKQSIPTPDPSDHPHVVDSSSHEQGTYTSTLLTSQQPWETSSKGDRAILGVLLHLQ
jgi:hypothetical protein